MNGKIMGNTSINGKIMGNSSINGKIHGKFISQSIALLKKGKINRMFTPITDRCMTEYVVSLEL